MGRKVKFPDPNDYPPKTPSVLCPADRVLALYNQSNEKQAKKISKSVRMWFFHIAKENGWHGGHFLPEVQSKHGAGCILWVLRSSRSVSIEISKTTLVLESSDGDDD